ncbi:MAG TPA: hypothetical protein VGP52_08075, partial [Stellaceae bacterium]|nr:hypothetical protein [Stellaceae bacterium]
HRRSGMPHENPLVFYPRRVGEVVATHARLAAFYLRLHKIRRQVERDPRPYTDPALTPIASPASFSFVEPVSVQPAGVEPASLSGADA